MSATIAPCVVVLPWPDSSLFINRSAGHHWSIKQDAKEAARILGYAGAMGANIGDLETDHKMTLTFEPPSKRRYDDDGLLTSAKHYIDGIAKALGIDDYYFNPVEIIRADPVEGGRVTVRIDDSIPF